MATRPPQQQFDLRQELISGDPNRQSRALLAVLGLLSAGREVGGYISLICQAVLGNSSITAATRCTAYDVVAAATPSDADCTRIAAAIIADLQKGTTPELRIKALSAVALLPAHRLLALLGNAAVRDRLSSVLRSPSPAVRASAIETIISLSLSDAVPAAAYYRSLGNDDGGDEVNGGGGGGGDHAAMAVGMVLGDAVVAAGEGLTDDDSTVVAAACRSLAALMLASSAQIRTAAASASTSSSKGSSNGGASSESARAGVVRGHLGLAAVAAVDDSFAVAAARFRILPTALQSEIPALLVAYLKAVQARAGVLQLDALPGDAVASRSHAFDESAALLSVLVRCGDPPAVLAAAQGLFELAEMDASSATLQALLPSAIAAAVGAAAAAGGHHRAVAEHSILNLLLQHLEVLPNVQRAALFPRLPAMIAAMPAAADRVRAFYLLWSAVAAYDWAGNLTSATTAAAVITAAGSSSRAARASTTPTTTPQLQHMLLDPCIKEAISGAVTGKDGPAGPPPHSRYRDPIFREEMVGTLLYALLTHPRPAAVSEGGGSGVVAASSAVAQASSVQAAAAAVDWLVTSKLALQGCKACLGWDRMAGVPTTGSTAAADLWLQLLLRCIHVSGALKRKLGSTSSYSASSVILSTNTAAAADGGGGGVSDPGAAALASVVRRASELEGELQGLLLQIAANWRALHPVVRPRAVWLCASHLHLTSVVDASWTALADAVHGLLADARAGDAASISGGGGGGGYMAAVAQGTLSSNSASSANTSTTATGRHAAGLAAGAGESEEVALLALERLSGLVALNHHGRLQGQLAPIAGMLEKLASIEAGLESSPAAVERLTRLCELLKPVSTAGKKKSHTTTTTTTGISIGGVGGRKQVGTESGGGGPAPASSSSSAPNVPIVVQLVSDGFTSSTTSLTTSASYPSTLPTAAALFSAPESTRYRKFLEQLGAAALSKSIAAGGGAAAVAAAAAAHMSNTNTTTNSFSSASASGRSAGTPSGGVPTLQQLARILEQGTTTRTSSSPLLLLNAVQVTGPAAPISLSLSHSIDPGAGSIRLRCSATNHTLQTVTGVAVTLLLGGPIAGNRRPLLFRLSTLPPGESSTWEVPLRVNGFGWPVVQPAVTLPAQVPTGSQPTLRCRPYSISPLQLLAPPARAMSPTEFYQRWQAMPHKAVVGAAPVERGPLGVQRVLAAVEAAGLPCVMKAVVPVAGGVHAAFYGSAWSGESIAVVVTSGVEMTTSTTSSSSSTTGATTSGQASLHLHFGSEASEVVAHVKGHESDLLAQLTGGAAVPAVVVGGSDELAGGVQPGEASAAREEDRRPALVSTFSFLRSVTLQMEGGNGNGGDDGDDEDVVEREAARMKETHLLHGAAVAQWHKVHAMRVGIL